MPAPQVSVVVPTHRRPARLERLLDALRGQSLGLDRFEVVIVADGAGEATRALLAAEQARGRLRLQVIDLPVARGPSLARNAGWRAASAPVIAFTDDDCRPTAQWLAEGLGAVNRAAGGRAGGDYERVIVQGLTRPDPSELGELRPLARTTTIEHLGPQYQTCNMFYPRALLEALGGFDETWGWGGEDTDLAWRAIEAGIAPMFAPDAVVLHAVQRLGVAATLRQGARWTPAIRLFRRHPQTRAILYRGRFWNVWHYLMWRSLLGLAGPRWLGRMLLTLHLLEVRKRAREAGGGARWVPLLLAHDLVECWAVARGALRYRTLVL